MIFFKLINVYSIIFMVLWVGKEIPKVRDIVLNKAYRGGNILKRILLFFFFLRRTFSSFFYFRILIFLSLDHFFSVFVFFDDHFGCRVFYLKNFGSRKNFHAIFNFLYEFLFSLK